MNATAEQTVLPMPIEAIAEFRPYLAELAKLQEENKNLVFDYSSKAGYKDARSYIAKLRKTKTPVSDLHKELKADILVRGRKLDTQKNEIIEKIDAMIDVHQAEIDKIDEAEKHRIAHAKATIDHIIAAGNGMIGGQPTAFGLLLHELEKKVDTSKLGEFAEEAERLRLAAIDTVKHAMAESAKRATEQAELDKLRQEKADRDAKDAAELLAKEQAARDERIRKDAETKAIKDAEDKAVAEKVEQAAREQKLKDDAERAEKEKQEAVARAAKDAAEAKEREAQAERDRLDAKEQARLDGIRQANEAVEREKQRAADAAAEQRRLDAKRAANEKHRERIINEALQAIVDEALTVSPDDADKIINLICNGKIPHVTITF